jgi:hypothetical protein
LNIGVDLQLLTYLRQINQWDCLPRGGAEKVPPFRRRTTMEAEDMKIHEVGRRNLLPRNRSMRILHRYVKREGG